MDVPERRESVYQRNKEIVSEDPFAKLDQDEKTYSVEEVVDLIGFGKYQILLLFVTGFSWMADSMEMMIIAILGPVSRCEWSLTPWDEALLSTAVFLGMFISSSLWGKIGDKFGRKSSVVVSSAWITYFGILSSLSPSYRWVLFLRFLVGFGISGIPQVVVLYAEFVPSTHRAATIASLGAFWAVGGMLEVLLAIVVMPRKGWRWLLALSSLPCVVFLCFTLMIPESPRYHMSAGQRTKAMETLANVARVNKRELPKSASFLESPSVLQERGQFVDLFKNRYWRTTLSVWVQMAGGLLIYYGILLMTPEIYEARRREMSIDKDLPDHFKPHRLNTCGCKSLEEDDYYDLFWTSMADLPALLIVVLFINRFGRIRTLVIGFFIMSVLLTLLMFCTSRTMTVLYIFGIRYFATGVTQTLYIYIPEVYPTNIRGLGLGTASAMARIGCILTPFLAQVLVKSSVNLTLVVYGACSLLCCIAASTLPIKTSGRQMEDSNLTKR